MKDRKLTMKDTSGDFLRWLGAEGRAPWGRRMLLTALLSGAMLLGACAGNARQAPPEGAAAAETSVAELQLPEIPMSVRDPRARADYLLVHFWENLDFGDTVRSYDADFMEQNFSNFISVFPHASEAGRLEAVRNLMSRAAADSAAYMFVAEIAEKYLYEAGSPMMSEEYYRLFLDELLSSPLPGEYVAPRYAYQLAVVNKNRPGSVAAEFSFVTRGGRRMSLHEVAGGGLLVVLFYDPECEHCHEVIELLRSAPELSKVRVLAVAADGERSVWAGSAGELPAAWTVGYNPALMELYSLRLLPSLYVLDGECRVVLKDVAPDVLLSCIDAL